MSLRRLAVISHTPHHRSGGMLVGWGPTVTELSHLAARFAEVVHVAPVLDGPPPASALPYTAANVRVVPVPAAGGAGLAAKAGLVAALPRYLSAIRVGTREADVIHIRSPANISAVALAYVRARRDPRPCWVKYAGNWRPEGPEPWSYRLQRRWLRRGFANAVVTVNGRWDDRPHVHAFPNPSLTDDDLVRGREQAGRKPPVADGPALAFVGRVEQEKGAPQAVAIAASLRRTGVDCTLEVVGDGPAMAECRRLARTAGIESAVTFHGWTDRLGVQAVLGRSHVLVLPSRSEGWPKVLSEAMAFGAVPVATAISSIPQTFADSGAGVAVDTTDVEAFVRAVTGVIEDPARLTDLLAAGFDAARGFTFGAYLDRLGGLFGDAWGIDLTPPGRG